VRSPQYSNLGDIKHVKDWEEFWKAEPTESLQGQLRFKLGDPVGNPVRHEAYRLQLESLGQAAGEGGCDLGADIDLVGPGAAYERWTKTDEYKAWFKDPTRNLDR
jgi:hypothetical protein